MNDIGRLEVCPTDDLLSGPGQVLPITGQATVAGEIIELEIAQTRAEQSLGLMHRTCLADNQGMLFPFAQPRRATFWMKNVPINLDMVFLRNGRVQFIQEQAPPCEVEPCPVYGPSNALVDQVLELRGGRSQELGLEIGDEIEVERLVVE